MKIGIVVYSNERPFWVATLIIKEKIRELFWKLSSLNFLSLF
jgi:hypothetical protein